jgi:hypothetical protein
MPVELRKLVETIRVQMIIFSTCENISLATPAGNSFEIGGHTPDEHL